MKIERKRDWLNVIRRLEKEATEWVGRGGRWAMGGVYSRSERPRPPLRTTTPAAAAANTDPLSASAAAAEEEEAKPKAVQTLVR